MENKEEVNLVIDSSLIDGNKFLLKDFGNSEKLRNFIMFSKVEELLGKNVNKFFPNAGDGIDLVIDSADKNNVNIKIIPVN